MTGDPRNVPLYECLEVAANVVPGTTSKVDTSAFPKRIVLSFREAERYAASWAALLSVLFILLLDFVETAATVPRASTE